MSSKVTIGKSGRYSGNSQVKLEQQRSKHPEIKPGAKPSPQARFQSALKEAVQYFFPKSKKPLKSLSANSIPDAHKLENIRQQETEKAQGVAQKHYKKFQGFSEKEEKENTFKAFLQEKFNALGAAQQPINNPSDTYQKQRTSALAVLNSCCISCGLEKITEENYDAHRKFYQDFSKNATVLSRYYDINALKDYFSSHGIIPQGNEIEEMFAQAPKACRELAQKPEVQFAYNQALYTQLTRNNNLTFDTMHPTRKDKTTAYKSRDFIFLDRHKWNGKTTSSPNTYRENQDKDKGGSLEFRLGVTPTSENLARAFAALKPLFEKENCPVEHMKIIDGHALVETAFNTWNPKDLTDPKQYDQRGKEICFYVAYDKDKKTASSEEYKNFMIQALKALNDAKVEGIGYHPVSVERSLTAEGAEKDGLPRIFSYAGFTMGGAELFQDEKAFQETGYGNPLEGIKLSLADYRKAGLSNTRLGYISQFQKNYLEGQKQEAATTILERLNTLSQQQPKAEGEAQSLSEDDKSKITRVLQLGAQETPSDDVLKSALAADPNVFQAIVHGCELILQDYSVLY